MRAALALGLVCALTIVGCLQGDDATPAAVNEPAPARILPSELVAPTLHPLQLLGMGWGEPNVAVAPDGTIYVAAINDIYRSDDGGASFELVKAGLDGGGDGDLAITPEGNLHWLGLFGTDAPIPYAMSADRGETWTDILDLSDETGADREWIDARQDEPTVYAAWRDSDDNGIVAFVSSFDGGTTWNERVTISEDAVGGPLAHGPLSGRVYQAQAAFSSGPNERDGSIRLARSADHGATWEVVPVLTPNQGPQFGLVGFPFSIFPVVSVDESGTLYLVYAVDQGVLPGGVKPVARFGVYLTVSQDEGDTWTEPRLLSSPDHAAIMPWIAAGASGRVAIVWYENTLGVPHDNLPDSWNVMLLEMLGADAAEPQMQLVQLNDAPNHIGGICTSGVACYFTGGDRSVLDFFEVALAPNGHPVVTWAGTEHPYQGHAFTVPIYARAVVDGTPLR